MGNLPGVNAGADKLGGHPSVLLPSGATRQDLGAAEFSHRFGQFPSGTGGPMCVKRASMCARYWAACVNVRRVSAPLGKDHSHMERNALQELIFAHCHETGETVSDIAARGGLARQTVSSIAHRDEPGAIPRRATLAKLAVGLGLSLEVVERAASLAAHSGPANGDLTRLRLDLLIDHAEHLSDGQLKVLVAAARAMRSEVASV